MREPDRATPALWREEPPAGAAPPPAAEERRERWLLVSVAVVTALVVLAAVSLAVVDATRPQPAANAPHTSTHPPASTGSSHTPPTSVTTAPAAVPGAPPVISSLSPSAGSAGQAVVITGNNFMSADGHIQAQFDGVTAPVNCPQPSSCSATVPPLAAGAANPAQVTVTTASGTSNAGTFTYR